jgi:peptide/nickel transport system permease protein
MGANGRTGNVRWYFANRIALAVVTIFFLASIMFALFRLLPGDPTLTVLSPALAPEVQAELRHRFGLDRPILEQYGRYLLSIATLNFGVSFNRGIAVSSIMGEALANTVVLMLPSMVLAYLFGVTTGAMIAWKRNSAADWTISTAAMVVRSAPIFWICIIFIAVFSIRLDIFPTGHMRTPGSAPVGLWDTYLSWDFLHHMILPTLVMAIYYGSYPLLVMRTAMLEVLGDDFIDLCKAKGLSERRVVFKHALRASLLPIATSVSLLGAYVVAGSVLVETVFSWPGLGRLMVAAVTDSDYPVAQASFLLIAVLVVAGNLVSDFLYGLLDPRVRYG